MAAYVYILASGTRRLYIGVTNDLARRTAEHRAEAGSRFAGKYSINRLVFFQEFGSISQAIAAEKRLKGWRRQKKVDLIERENAKWEDLAPDLWPGNLDIETRSAPAKSSRHSDDRREEESPLESGESSALHT